MIRNTRAPLSTVLLAALGFGGCAEADDALSERNASIEASSQAEVVSSDDGWRARATRDAEETRRGLPELARLVDQLEPRPTRAGFLRFTTSAIHDPAVAPLLLTRLAEGGDPPSVRAALVEALPRTGGDYAEAVVELLDHETDPDVRVALVASLRRAPGPHAIAGLTVALADDDPQIRALAAETAAMHDEGHALAEPLRAGLGDEHGSVRAAAARAMGVLGIGTASDELAGLVADETAEVRLEALRALNRIDPDAAARLPELAALRRDSDPRVARMTRGISAQ
jgi:hypothetical protein